MIPFLPPIELSTCDKSVVGIRKKSKPLNKVLATNPTKSPNVPPPIAITADFLLPSFKISFSAKFLYPSKVFIFYPHLKEIIIIFF